MRLKTSQSDEPEINLTPLIDVVFLMLIFFMVTTTFIREGNLAITLPEASLEPTVASTESVELVIDTQGNYVLDGRELVNRQRETLVLALRELTASATPGIVIRADASTPHQAVVTALDAAGYVGIQQIAIATVPENDD